MQQVFYGKQKTIYVLLFSFLITYRQSCLCPQINYNTTLFIYNIIAKTDTVYDIIYSRYTNVYEQVT